MCVCGGGGGGKESCVEGTCRRVFGFEVASRMPLARAREVRLSRACQLSRPGPVRCVGPLLPHTPSPPCPVPASPPPCLCVQLHTHPVPVLSRCCRCPQPYHPVRVPWHRQRHVLRQHGEDQGHRGAHHLRGCQPHHQHVRCRGLGSGVGVGVWVCVGGGGAGLGRVWGKKYQSFVLGPAQGW